METVETPDVLNSKIKKIRIELPHYSFSHSSSGDSTHAFIGRKRTRKKLKKVIEDSPDEPGVYLIAGNRGVGKTSLVSEVIKETSLDAKSSFSENFRYLVLLFLAVVGVQVVVQFCLQEFGISKMCLIVFGIVSLLIFLLSFISLCFFNDYRHKFSKQNMGLKFCDSITSALKELSYLINPRIPYGKMQYLLKIILIVSFAQIASLILCITPTIAFLGYLVIVLGYNLLFRFGKLKKSFLSSVKNYIKNHNRLYLRINFGHKLKDEKDILRLVARTLSTEYKKYRNSFWRMLPWRSVAFGFLFIFAYLFSTIAVQQESYTIKDNERLKDVFSNVETKIETKVNYADKILGERTTVETKVDTNIDAKVSSILLVLYDIAFKISKRVQNVLKYFLESKENLNIDNNKILELNFLKDYFFWLSFISMYLFYALLFRCNFITHFFVTHRIIMRRLKKLNTDITHSTERENTIGINSEKISHGIGTRTKKSRNVADVREIEKELQDILSDMQRIPVLMCRPNIVIVFDELDKVEPGDTNSEKETPQTKASMFSINATRERQTEILRILSNMKYFLSTAKAKFIFIAGREMYDIHLADVSERNNYIGSIFNAVIYVPSFLTDHPSGKKSLPEESGIASLPEEFVCRRLIPHDYHPKESYNLESYRVYLEDVIYKDMQDEVQKKEMVQKVIAILQQLIIYLAHLSKGAPKKMMQIFESFVIVSKIGSDDKENSLVVQRYHSSRHFLSFSYYRQYTLGIIAYLITPIFYRLAESNIKEHSDKLLVSSLRFVDFVFKFHKHSFSWKILDISPEMLEVNRAPELKSVAVDLLNYLAQVHINKSNFSFSEYKFDGLIANEIFAMAKTDDVFSALFSFSLDEMSPLKNHYKDLLEDIKKEYQNEKTPISTEYIDAISSLQSVLGDLYYYDDGLEEAETYYKSTVQALHKNEEMTLDQLYVYVRNMLRLGVIYEKRKQYDFAYLTYGELCKRIIEERNIAFQESGTGVVLRRNENNKVVFVKASEIGYICSEDKKYYDSIEIPEVPSEIEVNSSIASLQPLHFGKISPNTYDMLFKKMTFEGLKMLYLPFIAKLQILEQSHLGGITRNHLEQLDKEFRFLTYILHHKEAKLLEAEFYSRVADILYYKNSDLKCKKKKNRKDDEDKKRDNNDDTEILPKNSSCTACYYYHKALSILLNLDKIENKDENTVIKLLYKSVEQIKDNCNMKFCTILARILSDWGNVFFSCDNKNKKEGCECYICDAENCNTQKCNHTCACYICDINDCETNSFGAILKRYIDHVDSESKKENIDALLTRFGTGSNFTKMEIAFAMYAISLHAYRKANLHKRSAYQIYKMLCLFKHYEIYKCEKSEDYIEKLSKKAIHYLWCANENLNVLELNKRKKDFSKDTIKKTIPLQSLLVDSEITRIRILAKELGLKPDITTRKLKDYYALRITSPYKINYSIVGRIYRLRLKSKVNYKAYLMLINNNGDKKINDQLKIIFGDDCNKETIKIIFGKYFDIKEDKDDINENKIEIFENLIAETIYCLIDIVQLSETMDETYLFPHSFLGSIHEHLSFWIRLYETYEIYKGEKPKIAKLSRIDKYLKKYLDEEWREMLSGYRENQKALSHYHKCLEMHSEGRAYHNMIDTMCYIRDDYNDRSDHFNIAEERHLIVNGEIQKKIDKLKPLYEGSELFKVENYFEKIEN